LASHRAKSVVAAPTAHLHLCPTRGAGGSSRYSQTAMISRKPCRIVRNGSFQAQPLAKRTTQWWRRRPVSPTLLPFPGRLWHPVSCHLFTPSVDKPW